MQTDLADEPRKAIVASVQRPNVSDAEFEASLAELRELAKTLGYRVVHTFTQKRAGFDLLQSGGVGAVASVPVVVFSAPFLILRNTVRGRKIEGRPFFFVMAASMIASVWSLISGRVVLDLLMMLGAA